MDEMIGPGGTRVRGGTGESLVERHRRLRSALDDVELLARWIGWAGAALVVGLLVGVLLWFAG